MATALVPRSVVPEVRKKFAIFLVCHDPAVTPQFQSDDWETIEAYLSHWHRYELDNPTGLVPVVRATEGGAL